MASLVPMLIAVSLNRAPLPVRQGILPLELLVRTTKNALARNVLTLNAYRLPLQMKYVRIPNDFVLTI